MRGSPVSCTHCCGRPLQLESLAWCPPYASLCLIGMLGCMGLRKALLCRMVAPRGVTAISGAFTATLSVLAETCASRGRTATAPWPMATPIARAGRSATTNTEAATGTGQTGLTGLTGPTDLTATGTVTGKGVVTLTASGSVSTMMAGMPSALEVQQPALCLLKSGFWPHAQVLIRTRLPLLACVASWSAAQLF